MNKKKILITTIVILTLSTFVDVIFCSSNSKIDFHNRQLKIDKDDITNLKSSTVTVNTTETDFWYDGGTAFGVDVSGGKAYIADGFDGLEIIAVSDPSDIYEVNQYHDGEGEARKVLVSGDMAYVVERYYGVPFVWQAIEYVDLTYGILDYHLQATETRNIALSGDLYVASWLYGVEVFRPPHPISLPYPPYTEYPSIIGAYYNGNNASRDVTISDQYVYVADGFYGLEIYNRTDQSLVGYYNDGGDALDIFIVGDYAYVGEGSDGFEIIDISDPAHPEELGNYSDGGYTYDIFVVGDYAYVADGSDGLEIIDISVPAHPVEVGGYYDGSGTAYEVFVVGNYAYVADGDDGLEVIYIDIVEHFLDVTSPTDSSYWQTGDKYHINWYWEGEINNVRITLLKDGAYDQTINANTSNDGDYEWSVPGGLAYSKQYQIKIEDVLDPSVFDLSSTFEIYTNTITVLTPDSTTSWEAGKSQYIYWDYTGRISTVDIVLYEEGNYVDTIETYIPNEGSYYWTIDSSLDGSTRYQIKIMESGDPNIYSLSDYFTIVEPPIQKTPIWKEGWFWAMIGALGGLVPITAIIGYIRKRLRRKKKIKKEM